MIELFRAEWIKLVGNRWMSAFILWIFPVGTLAFVVVMSLLLVIAAQLTDRDLAGELAFEQVDWTAQAISVWTIPNSLFGRLLVMALTAIIFAGEYQWQTWKNIIPHNRRVPMVLAKFVTMALALIFSFSLMSLIMAAGYAIMTEIVGGTIGPALTGPVLRQFAQDYIQQASLAFVLIIISASFAALASMMTHSILGGALVGVFFTYLEGLSVIGLVALAYLFDYPKLVYLYRLTPSYNVANVKSWLTDHQPGTATGGLAMLSDVIDFADDINFSAAILLVWVIALVALTAYLFHKQDIT